MLESHKEADKIYYIISALSSMPSLSITCACHWYLRQKGERKEDMAVL